MSSQLIVPLFLISTILISSFMYFAFRIRNSENLIYEKKSQYHHIMIYEDGPIRTLRLGDGPDAGKQSRIDKRDLDIHLLEYTRLVFAGLLVNPEPERVLIIGLGGGIIPRTIRRHFPDCIIDVVDIDLDVVKAAEKYFFFRPEGNTRVHISDGRLFLVREIENNPGKKYDMVILDAFNMDSIPLHLVTLEFLRQVKAILDPKGVVVANILSYTSYFHSELKTYQEVFNRCYVFMGRHAKNTIFVAPGSEALDLDSKGIIRDAELLQQKHHFSFSMKTIARQFRPGYSPKKGAKLLRDEKLLNPSI